MHSFFSGIPLLPWSVTHLDAFMQEDAGNDNQAAGFRSPARGSDPVIRPAVDGHTGPVSDQ